MAFFETDRQLYVDEVAIEQIDGFWFVVDDAGMNAAGPFFLHYDAKQWIANHCARHEMQADSQPARETCVPSAAKLEVAGLPPKALL